MEDLQIFDSFELEWLDKDWIDSVWDSDFILYSQPPNEYELFERNENVGLLLKKSCTAVKAWLAGGNNDIVGSTNTEISWETLINRKVNVRGLLAVLGYMIKNGQHDDANTRSRQLCLWATNLYLILLAVPGSDAFNIFSFNLYQRALETFKLVDYLLPPTEKRMSMGTESFFEDNQYGLYFPNSKNSWKSTLLEGLCDVMCSLLGMIQTFRYRDHVRSLESTIKTLLEVIRLETDISLSYLENRPNGASVAALCYDSYVALESLCDYRHGLTDVTTMLIAKYSLPRLTFTPSHAQSTANARDALIYFLKKLSTLYEKEMNVAILTLFQNLMTQCPERLEMRQKQATVIIKLIIICDESTFMKVIENVILFSHNAKVGCRIFAQEIIGKLLSEILSTADHLGEETIAKIRKILVATVLSRCNDRSSMVRSKAMAIIADYTDANENVSRIFDDSESSSPDRELPAIDRLTQALKSVDSNPLPGAYTVVKMLMDRIEDERALVRRSALQTLKNIAFEFPRFLEKIVEKIGDRCRDPSLTVRRFAVQILTTLLERYPDNANILDEWMRTVTPQVFDVEVKVQEKMLESFRDLLLTRITRVTDTTNNQQSNAAADLPWQILQKLTSMKMRKHLSKACHLWVKNGMITKSIVTNVQSHIGSKNDIPAWVLLAAIAESQALPDMHKCVKDYKELIRKNDFHASLVLEVLRSSWSSLDKSALEDLYSYLYNSICLFDIDFGLISICIDIVDRVVRHLDPVKGQETMEKNTSKFMDLAEAEIQKFLEGDDQITMIAPIFLKAMSTLGHAALLCPHKNIQSSTLRILEGLILEYDALPDSLKKIEELRASAVVLLAQLAMRDREIAQEVIPIFGRLVRQSSSSDASVDVVLKVNAAKALADLCIRHTALVEPYLSDMCVSMRDPNPVLREVIVVIFIQLLLEDFIKANGPFFFHILTVLSDEDKTIRELTVFLIEERLLTKNKTLVSQRFLESLYHYNNYQFRREYGERKMREKERKVLTLPGHVNEDKRRVIYDFMLEHLDPPGKLRLIVKLTSQIFGGVCSGTINVGTEEGSCVLRDALYVMANHRLRPSVPSDKTGDDAADEEPTEVHINNAVKVIVDSTKRHGLDFLLPALTKLWKKLIASGSPLKKEVKSLLLKTLAEYDKNQLSSLFNEYPELEEEANDSRSDEDEDESGEFTEESELSPTTNSMAAIRLACLEKCPRVVLERLPSRDRPDISSARSVEISPDTNSPIVNTCKSQGQLDSTCQAFPRSSTPFTALDMVGEFSPILPSPRPAKMSRRVTKHRSVKRNLSQIQSESDHD